MVNHSDDPEVLFQHGDALDLHLGLDPQAAPGRTDAAAGDVRLLISYKNDKPVVMLYRYVTKPGVEPYRVFRSPVGETAVAEIRKIAEARVAAVRNDRRWTLEAAIPWEATWEHLSQTPTDSRRLPATIGPTSDRSSSETSRPKPESPPALGASWNSRFRMKSTRCSIWRENSRFIVARLSESGAPTQPAVTLAHNPLEPAHGYVNITRHDRGD